MRGRETSLTACLARSINPNWGLIQVLASRPPESGFVELARRQQGPIEVAMFWSRATSRVTVVLWNWNSEACLEFDAEPDRANYAFTHPYAYAAQHGVTPREIWQVA
jgi:hypothetical protein